MSNSRVFGVDSLRMAVLFYYSQKWRNTMDNVERLIALNERLVQQNNTLIQLLIAQFNAPESVRQSVLLKLSEMNTKKMNHNNETLQ